jgi:hypothetical protein
MITTTLGSISANPRRVLSPNQARLAPFYLAIVSSTLHTMSVLPVSILSSRHLANPTNPSPIHHHPQIRMLKNVTCQELCKSTVPPDDAEFINDRIREDQAINWLVDGLPAAEMKRDGRTNETFFDMGFNLGNDEDPEFQEYPALHNHYNILLK